ncbi:hypothetical protein [Dyadobacter sp. NIV53]|uniref:hypothetical protein n=1 Tax=Dyadobacter sp. NIV53 TaxID=2861765 RepID=UPI001C8699D0|nr:hypothetical protein [Dyadobacter sp. NIV53]
MPQASFSSVAGTWRLIEIEKGGFGQKIWEVAAVNSAKNLVFREDGAILDSRNLSVCCGPTSLLINGDFFEIKPALAIAVNPLCAVVNCTSCPTWEIEWNKNQLIISYCDGTREKYAR